jgi:hypothetical protein
MNTYKRTQCLLAISLAVAFAPALAVADDTDAALGFGALRGVALDAAGQPLAMASVAIHSTDGSADRDVVSDRDGVFAADRLKPGPYRITASKEGLGSSPATTVQVVRDQTARPYLVLAEKPASTMPPASAPAPLTVEQELQAMKDRIAALEAELKERPAVGAAPAGAAAPPSPDAAATVPHEEQSLVDPPKPQTGGKAPVPAVPPAPVPAAVTPDALQAPEPGPAVDNVTPFAFGDFTWLNGAPRNKDTVLDTKFFTPEIRFDTNYMEDFNQPTDHTIVGATESFRSGEVQIEQASVGGDFHWQNVRGRVLFMFGLFATTTPRNDASFGVGQWDLRGAYKYTSEAWGGYHFNVNHGLNVDAGIFVSYIGLFSYYNYDNWTYQPSYVS